MDKPSGVGLFYGNTPVAYTSFFPEDTETFMLYQMQGVRLPLYDEDGNLLRKKASRHLFPIADWKSLFLDRLTPFAQDLGFSQFGIQGGENNYWVHTTDEHDQPPLSLQRATQVYDCFAESKGFTKKENGNWYLPL
jgi:hypothetical protein